MSQPSASLPVPPQSLLSAERSGATFPIRELTHYLNGTPKTTQLKEDIMLQLERDPIMRVSDAHEHDLKRARERSMQKIRRMAYFVSNEPLNVFRMRMNILSIVDPGAWTRIGVHYGLFFGALQGQATATQFSYWAQKGAMTLNGIAGCFAMTELGHGSNVVGLETTATFDPVSDEIIIHTPTLTATKWWIGGAAQTCTHSVVYAQLYSNGKCHGVKCFVVQLRNPDTFELEPGIVIGDIGAKMGRHGTDNGWIQFTHVRVPRSHMLMKHTQMDRQGHVTEPALQQLAYGALITGRVTMIFDSGSFSQKALTIAIRYAAVRRQFGNGSKGEETIILNYPIHQYRLMPLLAQAFAMHFTGVEVNILYDQLMKRLGTLKKGDPDTQAVLDMLKELHGTSAGLKAFCTWNTLSTIDQCRQSLGGHGYSAYAGLASLYSDFAVQCTWEGDNTILTLQAGRYLVGIYRDVKGGKKASGGVSYLNGLSDLLKLRCNATSPEGVSHLDVIGEAYHLVAANVVKKAGDDFEAARAKGLKEEEAYEECSQIRFYAARMHSFGYLFHRFKDAVQRAPVSLAPILTKLCQLYGLYNISELSGAFLQYGYFSAQQMDWIRVRVNELCKDVRAQAIPLTDSFNFTDYVINSPLGRYDGNIYEHYFRMVQEAHPPAQVPPYFQSEIYPLLHRKLRDDDPLTLDD